MNCIKQDIGTNSTGVQPLTPPQADILMRIMKEREFQDRKWGEARTHPSSLWATILGEEVGEACEEVLNIECAKMPRHAQLRKELIQVAAVAIAWLEDLDRAYYEQHKPNGI